MAIFGNNNIKNGVMKVITEKIALAQKAHDDECDALDQQCEAEKVASEQRRDDGKVISANKHINSIVGKLI